MAGWCFHFAVPAGAPAALLLIVVVVANSIGVSVSDRLQLALAVLLVALLSATVLAAPPRTRLRNPHPFAPRGWSAVGSAAELPMWSFAGWEAITHLAADFHRPAQDLPRAAALAVAVMGVLCIAVVATSVLVLGLAAGTVHFRLRGRRRLGRGAARAARPHPDHRATFRRRAVRRGRVRRLHRGPGGHPAAAVGRTGWARAHRLDDHSVHVRWTGPSHMTSSDELTMRPYLGEVPVVEFLDPREPLRPVRAGHECPPRPVRRRGGDHGSRPPYRTRGARRPAGARDGRPGLKIRRELTKVLIGLRPLRSPTWGGCGRRCRRRRAGCRP